MTTWGMVGGRSPRYGLSLAAVVTAIWAVSGCGGDDGPSTGVDAGPGSDAGEQDGECLAPKERCGTRCINTQSDPANCGECGNACPSGGFCEMGECTRTCSDGFEECDASCVDTAQDPDHCGGCDSPCGEGRVCSGGGCVCADGLSECSGACVDTMTNNDHCGICDRECTAGEATCVEGSCTPVAETECLNEMDDDGDGLVDCEDTEDCSGTSRPCTCPDGSDGAGELCLDDGTWGECRSCEDPGCSPGDCDLGFMCTGGSCVLDPDSLWDVVVIDGDFPDMKFDGSDWEGCCFAGTADPQVRVQLEGESLTALCDFVPETPEPACPNSTTSPTWTDPSVPKEAVLEEVTAADIQNFLRVEVRDHDGAFHDLIADCEHAGLSDFFFDNNIHEVVSTLGCDESDASENAPGMTSLRIRLRPVVP